MVPGSSEAVVFVGYLYPHTIPLWLGTLFGGQESRTIKVDTLNKGCGMSLQVWRPRKDHTSHVGTPVGPQHADHKDFYVHP